MDFKTSHYIVFSDFVNSKKQSILYCTRTAQSVLISYDIRLALENNAFENISKEIIDHLYECKAIVDANEDELKSIVFENTSAINSATELYEVIQPSAMCQLGCDYCGQTHTKHNIDLLLYDKIIERISLKIDRGNYKSLHIGWFGGEPLMALNEIRVMTKKLKKLCNDHNMDYSAKVVTNGLSLKPVIYRELVEDMAIKQIEITLDGTEEYHDLRRYTKEGKKTFSIILNNIINITNSPFFNPNECKLTIRCNVDSRNFNNVSDLIRLLASLGLQDKIAYFYLAGVYSWAGNEAHALSMSKEEFAKKEVDWLIEMLELGFSPGFLPSRSKQVCLAVSPVSEMYDAYGNIFNCTEVSYTSFYQNTAYELGNLTNNHLTISGDRPLSDWNNVLLSDKFPCHTCKMLPVCGGGCPKSWYEDMRACPPAKFNIKEKLALAYVTTQINLVEYK